MRHKHRIRYLLATLRTVVLLLCHLYNSYTTSSSLQSYLFLLGSTGMPRHKHMTTLVYAHRPPSGAPRETPRSF